MHPIQLPTKVAGGQCLGLCHPHGRPGRSSWLLTLPWPSPSCYGRLGSKPVDERGLLFTFVFLSLCLSNKTNFTKQRQHQPTKSGKVTEHTESHGEGQRISGGQQGRHTVDVLYFRTLAWCACSPFSPHHIGRSTFSSARKSKTAVRVSGPPNSMEEF